MGGPREGAKESPSILPSSALLSYEALENVPYNHLHSSFLPEGNLEDMEKYTAKVESPAVLPLRDNLCYIQPGELPSNFSKCQSFGIKTAPPLAASSLLGQLTSHPYTSIPCSEMGITVLAS